MTKNELRRLFRNKRSALSVRERAERETQILSLLPSFSLPNRPFILSYKPLRKYQEMDISPMERRIVSEHPKAVLCYPITKEDFSCTLCAVTADTIFQESPLGIPEPVNADRVHPSKIDAVLTPLLCFDECGYRVGYGKGVYDGLFAQMRTEVLKIGFSYFAPVASIADIHAADIPLDIIITPNKAYYFSALNDEKLHLPNRKMK